MDTPSLKSAKAEGLVISLIAASWALFQLSLASFLILDSIMIRAIHLAFAIALAFLTLPWMKGRDEERSTPSALWIKGMPWILCGLGVIFSLYIVFDWQGLALRAGSPIQRDFFFGIALILFLLEAARRSVGPALPIIVIIFSIYLFVGPYLPDFLAFKGATLRKYVTQISLSSEGIYGIPLGVSASIVYLFVLLGAMLNRAGAGMFFTNLALSVLGRFRGGPAKAAVVASGFSGLISGSSIANIVTTGTFTIPLMKRVGYPPKKAAAIEVAASTDGQLMPPIMGAAAFIIAEYVNVPYIEVVKAAIIPALVSYVALFYITHIEASKLGLEGMTGEEVPEFWKTLKEGIGYLIPIGMLVIELVILRHTPETSAFRAIVVLMILVFFTQIMEGIKAKRSIASSLREGGRVIIEGMINGSKNMVSVALATAAAGIIVGIVGLGIGGMITGIVEYLSMGNIFLLLLITAMASLLLGIGLPTTATYIVMASLTAPVIVHVGELHDLFIPLMAAHLFCFYFGILADDTPPVGLASYTAAAIARSEPIPTGLQGFLYDIRTAIIPFFFVLNPDLILHNIDNPYLGLLIFGMAVGGAIAFTGAVQGWFITRNRWFEVPLLLLATLILFYPSFLSPYGGPDAEYRYYIYPVGLLLLAIVYWGQRMRVKRENRS